jgi:hypothetical protein
MFLNIVMLIVAAATSYGAVRQSRMARSVGRRGAANLWIAAAVFMGIIAVSQFVGLFT